MRRTTVVTFIVALALTAAGCSRDGAMSNLNPAAPSAVVPSQLGGVAGTEARGGGGGGGKGGGGSTTASTINLVMVSDVNGNGGPDWGDRVRFDVSTTVTNEPHVDLTCTQNGVLVYGATTGYFDGYPWPWTQEMTLSSTSWQGGAAQCTATLYYFKGTKLPVLATLNFAAGG